MITELCVTIGMCFLWAFWIMLPAYIPNPAAALLGGGTPIDFGKCAKDGRRIFGDGKTWRGLFGGIAAGVLTGALLMWIRWAFNLTFLPEHTWITVIALSIGALLGDLIKSYFKRRLGKERGAKWPVADMYDMVIGSLGLMTLVLLVTGNIGWFTAVFGAFSGGLVLDIGTAGAILAVLAAILIVSPLMHRCANIIGYMFCLKDVPW